MRLLRNILTSFSALIAISALGIVSSVLLARMLGPEGRGLLVLVLLLPDLANTLGLLGFEEANAVYAGIEPKKRPALVWQSAALALIMGGLIVGGGAYFFALGAPGLPWLLRGPVWIYVLALVTVPPFLLGKYWQSILRGMNHILPLNAVEVGRKAVAVILIAGLVGGLRLGVPGALWANLLGELGAALLLGGLLNCLGAWGKPAFDRLLGARTIRFAAPAQGARVAAYFNQRVDIFIIAALLSPADLGFYVVAIGLVERLWILNDAVSTALLPHLTNVSDRDPALSAVVARHVMVWTGLASLLLLALADWIVWLMYSSAFSPSVAPLRWLLPGTFCASVGGILGLELLAKEKPKFRLWAYSVACLAKLVATFLLVPRMGISGAALASSISNTLLSIMLVIYYLRETRIPWTALLPRPNDLLSYTALRYRLRSLVTSKA